MNGIRSFLQCKQKCANNSRKWKGTMHINRTSEGSSSSWAKCAQVATSAVFVHDTTNASRLLSTVFQSFIFWIFYRKATWINMANIKFLFPVLQNFCVIFHFSIRSYAPHFLRSIRFFPESSRFCRAHIVTMLSVEWQTRILRTNNNGRRLYVPMSCHWMRSSPHYI